MTKRTYIWASAHQPTQEQLDSLTSMGHVTFLKDINPDLFQSMTNCPSDRKELDIMARKVWDLFFGGNVTVVQPAGSPLFMYVLGSVLGAGMNRDVFLFAHSERVSEDIPQADGTVKKVSTFKHMGWV